MLLKLMVARGEVAAAGREGRQKLWDLAERIYPDDPVPDPDEALAAAQRAPAPLARAGPGAGRRRSRASRSTSARPASLRSSRASGASGGSSRRCWTRRSTGRAALLSPFDRLVQDRKRLDQLFDFDYLLEMYKPVEQRIWGYYALPILHGDRLVGKLDATAEPAEGVLRVDAVHEDRAGPTRPRTAVAAEIEDLARWLDLEVMYVE